MLIRRLFRESNVSLTLSKRKRHSKQKYEEKQIHPQDPPPEYKIEEKPDLDQAPDMSQSTHILNLPPEIFGEIMEAVVLNGLSSAMNNRLVCSNVLPILAEAHQANYSRNI
jgi:hypothetical protein